MLITVSLNDSILPYASRTSFTNTAPIASNIHTIPNLQHKRCRLGNKHIVRIMSHAPTATTDRIQEFYGPRPAQTSRIPQQQPRPQVQQQHTKRHIQSSDIAKPTRPEIKKTPVKAPAGSEFESFWWVTGFMDNVKAKASTQATVNDINVQRIVPAKSRTAPVSSNPNASTSRVSVATSVTLRAREAEQTAREDQLEYEAEHYSLWGEIVYIYKSVKGKRAKKKSEAARRKEHEARQRAREERAKQQVTCGPDAAAEEQSRPGRRPTTSPPSPLPLRPSQIIDAIAPDERLPIRKPRPAFSKNEGAVAKHAVKITQLPEIHKSVHLTKTPANNYRVQGEAESLFDYKRKSSNVTVWEDFMRKPSEPSERLAKLPPHVPTPLAPREQAQDQSDYRKRNGSAWTFTVPGEDDVLVHNTQPIFPNLNLPETITESPESQAIVDPHVCGLCGTLNSPKTHYNAQGIWLCTACRSPTSAKEVPPPPATPRKTPKRYRTRSGPRGKGKSTRRDENEEKFLFTNRHCECYDSFLPPIKIFEINMYICQWCSKELIDPASEPKDMRQSMKPEPLRSYHQRSASTDTPVSDLTSDVFARFDSDNTFTRHQSPEFQEILARRSRDMDRTNEDDFRPPPPKKDDGYVRKDSSTSKFDHDYDNDVPPPAPPPIKDAPLLSSKAFKPPPPLSTHYAHNSTRLSFYPDTPHVSPQSPSPPVPPPKIPNSPPMPPRPTRKRTPKDSIKGKDRDSTPPPPTLPGIPSDFHYAPPPIPDETVHRPKRSSSFYPEDGDGRYTLPALEFAARLRNEAPERRNTSFYDFWKPILEEKSRSP